MALDELSKILDTAHLVSGAFTVIASGPAAGPALSVLEFLLGSADAASSRRVLFGVEYPADEFVAGKRGDVVPRGKRGGIGAQRGAQVGWYLVHDSARYGWAVAATTVNS